MAHQEVGIFLLVDVRVGHQDGRQPHRRQFAQGRGAGPADGQVGGGQGIHHLLVQVGVEAIAGPEFLRQTGGPFPEHGLVPGLAADMDDRGPPEEFGEALGHGQVDGAGPAASAVDEEHPFRFGKVETGPDRPTVGGEEGRPHRVAGDHDLAPGQVAGRIGCGGGHPCGQPGQKSHGQARHHIGQIDQQGHPFSPGRQTDGDTDISAGDQRHVGRKFPQQAEGQARALGQDGQVAQHRPRRPTAQRRRRDGGEGDLGLRFPKEVFLHAAFAAGIEHLAMARQGGDDGQGGIDVPTSPAARDQHAHRLFSRDRIC